jgi:hypothetical protein
MACKKTKRNYGALTEPMAKALFNPLFILALAIGIPVFIFGLGSIISLMSWMAKAPTAGGIPVWALFVGGIVVLIIMKGKKDAQTLF